MGFNSSALRTKYEMSTIVEDLNKAEFIIKRILNNCTVVRQGESGNELYLDVHFELEQRDQKFFRRNAFALITTTPEYVIVEAFRPVLIRDTTKIHYSDTNFFQQLKTQINYLKMMQYLYFFRESKSVVDVLNTRNIFK